MPRKLYNFRIDPDIERGLKELAAAERTSVGAVIRKVLAEHLKRAGILQITGVHSKIGDAVPDVLPPRARPRLPPKKTQRKGRI